MAIGDRKDPLRAYVFRLELGTGSSASAVAGFRECSGLTANTDPVEYREGTDVALHARKLTGLRHHANLVLKRGFTDNKDLFKWYKTVLDGVPERRDGAVVLQDETHTDVLTWTFENGWICKWEGPMLNATSNDVAIESLEICVEQLVLKT